MQVQTYVPPLPAQQHPQTCLACTPAGLKDRQQQVLDYRSEQEASGPVAGWLEWGEPPRRRGLDPWALKPYLRLCPCCL